MPTVGLNLRVSTDSKQGGRKYMEDVTHIKFQKGSDGKEIEFAYFGVFDGHGGTEAALFAKEHLLDQITKNKSFFSENDSDVKRAIKEAFLSTHKLMWKAIGKSILVKLQTQQRPIFAPGMTQIHLKQETEEFSTQYLHLFRACFSFRYFMLSRPSYDTYIYYSQVLLYL